MYLKIEPKKIIDTYSTPIIQQTSFWSKVKEHLGLNSRAFEFSVKNSDIYSNVGGYCHTNADFVVFFQYLNKEDYIAYLPYGPEIEPSKENQGAFLEELSECLKSYLPKHCVAIRYDLNWESHWCKETDFSDDGNWAGLPDKEFQEFHINYGTNEWNLKKSNINILPANTIVLDLNKNQEEILARMKPKTRYNIKLSQKWGIEVKSVGIKGLDVWYNLYTETAIRNGLFLNNINYFRSVFTSKMECPDDEVNVQLLIAYYDKMPLAAMFLVMSAHRATYLYGASSSQYRNMMPTYALQWAAIKMAKCSNCNEYDMFGIAPCPDPSHPMYGLYKFKHGFGGEIYHQLGCWDYPIDKYKYNAFSACEMKMQGYYK
ncbi:MAG: peptidoglycan bridge formation glycyltransferase FemA/FemB family protein [Bacteroidales bacterium]|jgi:lipid II:glycine glycyltransferase (peptidoglycan interpeptide bridge formation enzyme)|nr:peptidoglycan bridge formation glycyltransferase FemA/FemB family protein [Bacteroidales bacterium]MDD2205125.1 peptidoglycan bridge formation glycyltransferase FemA/FemB family protein [Bacteroidales bacterium]MDD3151491.1 peptidoglycan bridge formation glycyltransferase FemA/FemB family protein [Bacteroidales bacterium]MDD3914903.1 peptidoglycan bridge formation glycyltransferase FemA/FemB family protein [Bacteroidales bacterium]MDD4634689.1 peptidoglycan bridge formation glycyltransferase